MGQSVSPQNDLLFAFLPLPSETTSPPLPTHPPTSAAPGRGMGAWALFAKVGNGLKVSPWDRAHRPPEPQQEGEGQTLHPNSDGDKLSQPPFHWGLPEPCGQGRSPKSWKTPH